MNKTLICTKTYNGSRKSTIINNSSKIEKKNNKNIFYLLPQGDSDAPVFVVVVPLLLVLPLAAVVGRLQRRRGCQVLSIRSRGGPEGVLHRGHLVVLLGGAEGVREGLGLTAGDLRKIFVFF